MGKRDPSSSCTNYTPEKGCVGGEWERRRKRRRKKSKRTYEPIQYTSHGCTHTQRAIFTSSHPYPSRAQREASLHTSTPPLRTDA